MTTTPVVSEAKLKDFGTRMDGLWVQHVADRLAVEQKWMKNLRQWRGIYDPEILALIPVDRSKAYPKMTRWKGVAAIARLLQMLFPNTEKNYAVKTSPLPELSAANLQQVLDGLMASKPEGADCTDEEIEKAIHAFAKGKAERMELKVDDDLQGMDYVTLARRVVASAIMYSIGVLKGPLHEKIPARTWEKNPHTGKYAVKEIEKYKPLYEFLSTWDWYPDMTATTLDAQDGAFERHVLARHQVEELAARPDFDGPRILRFLSDSPGGNYAPQWWESEMKGETKSDRVVATGKESRKFEAHAYWGMVTGRELAAAGVTVAESDLGKSFHANVWMLGSCVIKAKLAPLGNKTKHHHVFMFEEDDLSLLGTSLCDTLRDSQISICEIVRAAHDNVSVIGPMVELNTDLLAPGSPTKIQKHQTFRREGEGSSAQYPAVRDISVNSHLPDLMNMLAVSMDFADKESGLPPPSMGDVSGGGSEALRTTKNASAFLGAAALPIRDTVRNFDTFTVSVVSGLVAWNMKYDKNATRDGDHNVIARGATSLIAKEVLQGSLDEFRVGITEDEMPHLKTRGLLITRMKVRDLPLDELLEDEEVAKQTIQRNAQLQQTQMQDQADLVHAQVEEAITNAFKNAALARKADSSISVDTFEAIVSALEAGAKAHSDQVKAAQKPKGAA